MTISSPELVLTGNLRLMHPLADADLPDEVVPADPADTPDHLVVVLTSAHDTAEAAADHGRAVLADLLGSLQLFGDGRVELGELVFVRIDGGRWRPLALAAGPDPRGMLLVTANQEDELRAFCNLVSRRAPEGNAVAWALDRFQMGCAREDPLQALPDYLSALRALLEADGAPRGALAGRLAALCAVPDERAALAELMGRALALERDAMQGRAVSNPASTKLVRTVGDHLRALLRDVICGHLDPDVAALADELLVAAGESADRVDPEATTHQPRITASRSRQTVWGDDAVWVEDDQHAVAAPANPLG
jgi:hypothetical protein